MCDTPPPDFKKDIPFEKRLSESTKVLEKYPDRVPVICQKSIDCKIIPVINKIKYLVPISFTVGQFIHIIRKRTDINPGQDVPTEIVSTIVVVLYPVTVRVKLL